MMTSLQGKKAPCASIRFWITFFECNGRTLSDLATHWDGSQNSGAGEMASDMERGLMPYHSARRTRSGNDVSHNAWRGKEETENVPGVL